jgi:hypothetical protein
MAVIIGATVFGSLAGILHEAERPAAVGGPPMNARPITRTSRPPPESFQLYASAPSDPLARRPVDGLRAVAYALLLVGTALLFEIGHDLDQGLYDVITSFPGFLKVIWLSGFWLAIGWSVALLVIAAFRKCPALALEGLSAAALAIAISAVLAAMTSRRYL